MVALRIGTQRPLGHDASPHRPAPITGADSTYQLSGESSSSYGRQPGERGLAGLAVAEPDDHDAVLVGAAARVGLGHGARRAGRVDRAADRDREAGVLQPSPGSAEQVAG